MFVSVFNVFLMCLFDVVDDNNIDPVAEILQDLDRFRNAFVQVLRWDDLDKQDDSSNIRQISGKLNHDYND